jgi:CheY-like chemotaxis protein
MDTAHNQKKIPRSSIQYTNPHQKTVLYIGDDSANISLVKQLIKRCNDLRLLTANSYNGGILMAQDFQPHVIVMDINLPNLNGVEALKILRSDPITTHIPIIALSSDANSYQIDESGIKTGFLMHMTKPVILDDFMNAIDATISSSVKIH